MIALDLLGGPFDSVLDVGGNLGDFAEAARDAWPDAWVTSFEPLPEIAEAQTLRARGRWQVEEIAISDVRGTATLYHCLNQHAASSLQPLGPARAGYFQLQDRLQAIEVRTTVLDDYLYEDASTPSAVTGSLLIKVDVEGHERQVLMGAEQTLARADTVMIEMQNDAGVFEGAAPPALLDGILARAGLRFAGLADCFLAPTGRVLQFDAIYRRYIESH